MGAYLSKAPTNVRLGYKEPNTLAYMYGASMRRKHRFITSVPGVAGQDGDDRLAVSRRRRNDFANVGLENAVGRQPQRPPRHDVGIEVVVAEVEQRRVDLLFDVRTL